MLTHTELNSAFALFLVCLCFHNVKYFALNFELAQRGDFITYSFKGVNTILLIFIFFYIHILIDAFLLHN
jgi:hypothetical protein